jgi:hypothetical protein
VVAALLRFAAAQIATVRRLLPLLLSLLLCRAALGIGMAIRTPAWEAYDEPFHFAYAAQLARQGTLPDSGNPMHIHPPAYHALIAAFMQLSGSLETPLAPPDHNWYFYAGSGNPNFALPARTAEQRSTQRDLIAARLFTALIALIAAAVTWRTARAARLNASLAFCATVFFACHPQALFSGSTLNNDAAAMWIGALIAWCLVAAAQGRRARFALTALALSIFGSAVKLSVLPLSVAAALALVFSGKLRQWLGYALLSGALIAVGAFAAGGSDLLLPFAAQVHGQMAPLAIWGRLGSPLGALLLGDALRYGATSAFGIFGWGTIQLPSWTQGALWLGVLIGALGIWRVRCKRTLWTLLSASLSAIAAALALSLLYYNGRLLSARYLLPSLAAWAIALALCWRALGRLGAYTALGMACALLALSAWLAYGGLAAYYAPPIQFVAVSQADGTPLSDSISLRAYEVLSPSVRGGESVVVALTWQAERAIHQNYTLRLAFIGADGELYGWLYTFHGNGLYPTTAWRAGTAFREVYRVPIRRDVPAPSIGHVQVMLVEAQSAVLLSAAPIRVH